MLAVAGFVVGLPTAAAAAGTAAPSNSLVRPHQLASLAVPNGSTDLGALPGTQSLSLSVVLPPSNGAGLKTLLANLYDPSSSQYHQWLGKGQFDAQFGPLPSQVASVESWLHGRGVNDVSFSGFAVHFSAPARTVSAALGISFKRFRSRLGNVGYVASDTPLVPESLAGGQVQSILGLNTLIKFQPEELSAGPIIKPKSIGSSQPQADGLSPCGGATNETDGGEYLTMDQVGAAYGIGGLTNEGDNGHGELVGVYELAPHSASDVSKYLNCFGLTNEVATDPVDGGAGAPSNGTGEADLDIEQIATQAPKASIISYEGPNSNQGAYDVWNTIVSADAVQTVSTSWGECEAVAISASQGGLGTYGSLFEQAATQGQSIFAATGDSGSEDCYPFFGTTSLSVDYPGSDPLVTAVGGTSLAAPATDPPSETVWNDCRGDEVLSCADQESYGAGGGGVSDYEARPTYQPDAVPIAKSCSNECREVPDVSANAGTYMVFYDGGWGLAKGTSFAAPFWAGLNADKNDSCASSTGLFNPALYALYDEGSYGSAFNDIGPGQGDNDLTGSHHGTYATGTGYDLATGIGSPIAQGLTCPEVTSVGEGLSGQEVTITGTGLENATIDFGDIPATVNSATSTQATVTIPPGSGTVSVSGISTALGQGSTVASFTYEAITTTSLAPGVIGTPYSQTLEATGVPAPDSWSVTSGKLPSGLLLNAATGAITGTPETAGGQSVTFKVTGAHGVVLTATLSVNIFGAGTTTSVSASSTVTDFGDSVTYTATVAASDGPPTGGVTFAAGSTVLCSNVALSSGVAQCISTLAPAGTVTVSATYSEGVGESDFAPSTGTTSILVSAGPYSAITPVRICDTRASNPSGLIGAATQCNGAGNVGGTIAAGATKDVNVAGNFTVPSTATSVVLNVTVVDPTGSGFLTVFPDGSTEPGTSDVNYVTGEVVPNLVEIGVGVNGDVSFYASRQTDIVVDVEGYTSATPLGGAGAGLYTPLTTPTRICDTRPGNPSNLDSAPVNQCDGGNAGETLHAFGSIPVQVADDSVIPSAASAAVLNVTVVNPTSGGFLTVYPEGASQPVASNLNFTAGLTTTNRVIVPLSSSGFVEVFSSAPADVVVDLSGSFSSSGGTGAQFNAEATPVRICDTRSGNPSNLNGLYSQCAGRSLGPGGAHQVQVVGLAGVPANASAVVVNLTGVDPSGNTFLTVFPGPSQPVVSDLNPPTGQVRANLAVATLNANGTISIYNHSGVINVVVDVLGWYSPPPP